MKNAFKIFLIGCFALVAGLIAQKFGGDAEGLQLAGLTTVALPIKNSIAEKEMLKELRHEHTWAGEIKSKQGWVNQDTIKIPKRGAAPKVLVNNKQYPIVKNGRDDSHIILSLNKFDTENTVVTEDELNALPYDKLSDVQAQHRETLEDETMEYGLYGLAPDENDEDSNLFVIETTGADDGTGRKRLTSKDVRNLQTKMNKKAIAKKGRVLVLCDDHHNDLLDEDKNYNTQYHNHKEGEVTFVYYGFKMYVDSTTPEYDNSLVKLPYDSLTTGRKASVIFHAGSTAKAVGTVKRFARPAELDPENRENTVGFQLYHIIIAYGVEGSAAVVSGRA